jgi:D-alanine-D-alanine ligase-like ATP-grasp enzyme
MPLLPAREDHSTVEENCPAGLSGYGLPGLCPGDFRLRGNIPYVLEVNANPCINPDDSGFVRSSKAAGYSYTEMVMKILEAAVQDRLQVPQGILAEEFV